jgi:hypothetical protein
VLVEMVPFFPVHKYQPNIISVIKPNRTGWAGQVVCTRNMRNVYKVLVGKPEWKDDNML